MSDDPGALQVIFRLAAVFVAAEGVTKAAGAGYSRRMAAYADAWMPLAEAMSAVERHLDAVDDWIRSAEDQALTGKSFAMTVRGAQEPHQMPEYDPALFPLHAHLGAPGAVPHVNGAAAPEGGQ